MNLRPIAPMLRRWSWAVSYLHMPMREPLRREDRRGSGPSARHHHAQALLGFSAAGRLFRYTAPSIRVPARHRAEAWWAPKTQSHAAIPSARTCDSARAMQHVPSCWDAAARGAHLRVVLAVLRLWPGGVVCVPEGGRTRCAGHARRWASGGRTP